MRINQRKNKRDELANNVAQEVRYQFATFGNIIETDVLYQHLIKWMEYTGENKYVRPKYNKNKLPF